MKVLFFVENMSFFLNCSAGLKVTIKYFRHLRTLENYIFLKYAILFYQSIIKKQNKQKIIQSCILHFCEVAGRSFFFLFFALGVGYKGNKRKSAATG